jgi:(p)ppGpp synthase/HD superfamily hydrolase
MPYGEKFEQALPYAARLHKDQVRKGTSTPYVTHLLAVASIVGEIVDGCTDTYETPKPPWRERKERYLAHLADAPGSVRLVSSADKLHNARTVLSDYRLVGEDLWSRFNGGKEGTLWYYRAIVDALRGDGPVVEDLDGVVTELEAVSGTSDSV